MAIVKYKNTLIISTAAVTNGTVATAGSILIHANLMGTSEPTKAATDIELITDTYTAMADVVAPRRKSRLILSTNILLRSARIFTKVSKNTWLKKNF